MKIERQQKVLDYFRRWETYPFSGCTFPRKDLLYEGITITKVKQKLYKIPPDKLQEIDDFIDFVLTKTRSKPSRRIEKLKGIWKGLGFERILDLDESIREIRRDSEKSLLDRIAKCGT